MAYERGDLLPATVTEVKSNYIEGGHHYAGHTTVEFELPEVGQQLVSFVHGSIVSVPLEDRVVGRKGSVRWDSLGGYNGWFWVKTK